MDIFILEIKSCDQGILQSQIIYGADINYIYASNLNNFDFGLLQLLPTNLTDTGQSPSASEPAWEAGSLWKETQFTITLKQGSLKHVES